MLTKTQTNTIWENSVAMITFFLCLHTSMHQEGGGKWSLTGRNRLGEGEEKVRTVLVEGELLHHTGKYSTTAYCQHSRPKNTSGSGEGH